MGKETTRHDENLGAVIYNSAPLFMILVFGAFSNVFVNILYILHLGNIKEGCSMHIFFTLSVLDR